MVMEFLSVEITENNDLVVNFKTKSEIDASVAVRRINLPNKYVEEACQRKLLDDFLNLRKKATEEEIISDSDCGLPMLDEN